VTECLVHAIDKALEFNVNHSFIDNSYVLIFCIDEKFHVGIKSCVSVAFHHAILSF